MYPSLKGEKVKGMLIVEYPLIWATFLKSTYVQNSSNSFIGNSKTSRAAVISSSVRGRVKGSGSYGFSS